MRSTFYIVLAFIVLLAASATSYGAVEDIDGDVIFRGSYYVLPAIRGRGGGLTLAGRGGELCPLDIVQEASEVELGIPVKFSNWKSRGAFVPESENLNIQTDVAATICVQSTYWRLGEFDEKRNQYFVVAGPKPEESGEDSFKSFFKIERHGDFGAYKFLFCPYISIGPQCSNVGIFVDELGVRRLALSEKPFLVMFKKANTIDVSSKTI